MADEIGKLLKNEDSSSLIKPAASQKKLRESKKRLNDICRSLLIDTEAYEPKRTANSVDAYTKWAVGNDSIAPTPTRGYT